MSNLKVGDKVDIIVTYGVIGYGEVVVDNGDGKYGIRIFSAGDSLLSVYTFNERHLQLQSPVRRKSLESFAAREYDEAVKHLGFSPKSLQHECSPVDVGFNSGKKACKHCDKDM